MKKLQHLFATTLALIGSAVALHAQPVSVSINFVGADGNGVGQWGSGFDNPASPSLDFIPVASVAGAPGFVQSHWNNMERYGSETSGFKDYTGADSGLALQWDSPWILSSGSYLNLGTPDSQLMDGMEASDWGSGVFPGPVTASSAYGVNANQKPCVYVGNIKQWLTAQGAASYSVVLYVQGAIAGRGVSEHLIQSVLSGSAPNYNMVPGPVIEGPLFSYDSGAFTGTYTQIPSTANSYATASATGNYMVFNGLTNDAIILVTGEPTGAYDGGKLCGFQIVATPPTPITTAPTISPNPAYALSPVTVTELASSATPMTYQWQTDGGSGGSLTNISGATSLSLMVTPPDQGITYTNMYACAVANSFGTVTSVPSALTVYAANAPYVATDTNPTNVYAFVGGAVTFNASFSGTQPITNQWQVNKGSGYTGIGLTATTNQNLVLANIQLTDAGTYEYVGTNVVGHANSTPTALTVQADPALPTPSQPYAYDVVSKSPVAYWRLNEAVDPSTATYQAFDSSGHNLNATYGSGVTKVGVVGPRSPAIQGFESGNTAAGFTASTANGAVVVPPLNLSSANVTITAWIYPTAVSPANGGLLVNTTPTSTAGLGFGGNTDTNVSSPTYQQTELGYRWNLHSFGSGLFPPLNTWSYVALTVTPTNATIYLCYFDGTKTNVYRTVNNNVVNNLETFNAGNTWLGGRPTDTTTIFNGSIDEVAVYNSTLTDDQVLNLYFIAQGGGVKPIITQDTTPTNITTFAGQTVSLSGYGVGYPAASFQWQAGSGGVFHNLADAAGHIAGANSSTLSIKTTIADALDYRLVLANANGSATTSVATVSLTPIPLNGIWTVNYAIISGNNGAPITQYSGPGVLGSGTFWNALTGGNMANTTTFRDDGVTASGINFACTNYTCGTWNQPNTGGNALLMPYANHYDGSNIVPPDEFDFTNVPNGTYNLVVYAISGNGGQGGTSGSTYWVNGVTNSTFCRQDIYFNEGDNTLLFTNLLVTNGSLDIGVDTNPTGGHEWVLNGVQLQAVSITLPVLSQTYSGGSRGNLTLTWNTGTLVSTTNLVTGPWVAVPGAVSPFQTGATNQATFFRVKL